MNRPIKFRMWRDGRMQQLHNMDTSADYDFDFNKAEVEGGQGGILMQFTGLKDKNGVEIYEGDIVTFLTRRYHLGVDKGLQTIKWKSVVVWEDGSFLVSENQENDSFLCAHNKSTDNPDGYEVIGNIYTHPQKPILGYKV